MISELKQMDCMDYMRQFPDKFFDLAIVDPPYGGGQNLNFRFEQVYENKRPGSEYWEMLFRVSKNQIVWGGNYFTSNLPESRCWISWYKGNPVNAFSDFELAWTSFDKVSKSVKLESYGFNHADRRHSKNSTVHPTQKPVSLYRWLIENYAQPGFKILDTHLGSGSSRIAAHDMKCDFWSCEIDPEYVATAEKRFQQYASAPMLF